MEKMDMKRLLFKRQLNYIGLLFFVCIVLFLFLIPISVDGESTKKDYGVFISLDNTSLDRISEYRIVVIDAQYFSKKDISFLHEQGCTVFSYINIGSLESFRDYYGKFSNMTLGEYENWDEECWMDVSQKKWQTLLKSLQKEFLKKNVDGFFVDNCDVYYKYPTEDCFKGITAILTYLMESDKQVIVNGGDAYVMEYLKRNHTLETILTGVNQESVWTRIDFERKKLVAQDKYTRKYFQEYLSTCSENGVDIYLVEYTKSKSLKQKIRKYCKQNKFHYYISDSLELD